MKKVVYIIPGYTESIRYGVYSDVARLFRRHHMEPRLVSIHWKQQTMADYVTQFLRYYRYEKNTRIYLFGFSFGAMIAFLAATRVRVDGLYLCGLSPYFKEDLPILKKSWRKTLGKRRLADFRTYSFADLAKKIECPVVLLMGTREPIEVYRRSEIAQRLLRRSELIIVEDVSHELAEYVPALKEVLYHTLS